jgi:hypothetical protein
MRIEPQRSVALPREGSLELALAHLRAPLDAEALRLPIELLLRALLAGRHGVTPFPLPFVVRYPGGARPNDASDHRSQVAAEVKSASGSVIHSEVDRLFAETRPVTCRCAYCDFTVSAPGR